MVSVAQTLLQRKICGPIWQMLLQAWSGVFHGRGDSFWGQRCCDKAPGVNVLTGKDLLPPLPGPKTHGEDLQEGERHRGGEQQREAADGDGDKLQQGRDDGEQRGPHEGEEGLGLSGDE